MRKIINGRIYDTETARKLFEADNDEMYSSPFHVCETLYRTRTGYYFLHGVCGYLSAFSRTAAFAKVHSENIKIITETDAIEWVKHYGTDEDMKKILNEKEVKK